MRPELLLQDAQERGPRRRAEGRPDAARGRLKDLFPRVFDGGGVEIDAAHVHRSHRVLVAPASDDVLDGQVRSGQAEPALAHPLEAGTPEAVAAGLARLFALLVSVLDQAGDAEVQRHARRRNAERFDGLAEDVGAVAESGHVALRLREDFEKALARRGQAELVHERQGMAGVGQDFARFDAPDIGEEPTTARVHELGAPLELEEREHPDLLRVVEGALAVPREPDVARARIGENVDVVIARRPRVGEELRYLLLVTQVRLVLQKLEGLSQRRAPGLVPSFFRFGGAAAVAVPAADTVRAAPGSALTIGPGRDLHFHGGGILDQEGAVVGELHAAGGTLDG